MLGSETSYYSFVPSGDGSRWLGFPFSMEAMMECRELKSDMINLKLFRQKKPNLGAVSIRF
jgi:hypothetical protein